MKTILNNSLNTELYQYIIWCKWTVELDTSYWNVKTSFQYNVQ